MESIYHLPQMLVIYQNLYANQAICVSNQFVKSQETAQEAVSLKPTLR